jgi:two-component system NtrC family sensor kinase
MKIPLRIKLFISFTAVIIISGLASTLLGSSLITAGIINQAQDKVKTDLNSAREIYREKTENIKNVIRFTSVRFFIREAIMENKIDGLKDELEDIRERESLDVLTLTDKNGIVILRSRNPSVSGDSRAEDDLVKRVLSERDSVASTVIVSKEELQKEGRDLADQAHINFIPTPMAKSRPETKETSGMMIKAAAPVLHNGTLIGVLYGGVLLNRNYEIVDKVKEIVYKGDKYKGKDIGTSTIFQWDLRVSTNVEREDGTRAIGTRVSKAVYEQVLEKGLSWTDRAFVVNNWYITAYEPIRDINDRIIGILYVGILEEKFTDMRKRTVALFLGVTLSALVVAFVVSNFLAGGVTGPVKHLVSASNQWSDGNLDYRVKIKSNDELGDLGETFNLMASSLRERDDKIKEYTERQIMKSDRLATIGHLAAGVAHEINNPLGAVMMYVHLALEDLDAKELLRNNLEKAAREVSRCKNIVKGLLDFAHQTEPRFEEGDINEVLEHTLMFVENQAPFQNVKIVKHVSPSMSKVIMDTGQIQQVFTNIVINAAEAMEAGGELTVTTRMSPDGESAEIKFTDTGCGIPSENLDKIFDPFFTTKEIGRGTGLGLSVSYGIITRHKGIIKVQSRIGCGTTFTIILPVKRKET